MSRKRQKEDPNRVNVRVEVRRDLSDRAEMAREASWSKEMIYGAFSRILEWLDSGECVALPGWMLTEYAPVSPDGLYWLMPDGTIRVPDQAA